MFYTFIRYNVNDTATILAPRIQKNVTRVMQNRLKQRDVCEHGTVVAGLDAVVRPRRANLVRVRRPATNT